MNFFKNSNKSKDEKLGEGLDSIWFLVESLSVEYNDELYHYDDLTKFRSVLFFIGVLEAYCKAYELSKDKSVHIFNSLDYRFMKKFGLSIDKVFNKEIMTIASKDNFLKNIVKIGFQSYHDFVSEDSKRGGMVLTRFGSLVNHWNEYYSKPNINEKDILSLINNSIHD